MSRLAITTEDNPYDPIDEWDKWYIYDLQMGYNTCELLSSNTIISDNLSDLENNYAIEDTIDKLVKLGTINNYGEKVKYIKIVR